MVDQFFVPDQKYLSRHGIYNDSNGVRISGIGCKGCCCHLPDTLFGLYGDCNCRGQRMAVGFSFEWSLSVGKIKAAISKERNFTGEDIGKASSLKITGEFIWKGK